MNIDTRMDFDYWNNRLTYLPSEYETWCASRDHYVKPLEEENKVLRDSIARKGKSVMPEFIELREQLKQQLEAAERKLAEQQAIIKWWEEWISESDGVAGYHRNGDIALWDEFDIPPSDTSALDALIESEKAQLKAELESAITKWRNACEIMNEQDLKLTTATEANSLLHSENSTLRARLNAWESQEPVAWMADDGRVVNFNQKKLMHTTTFDSFSEPLIKAPKKED